MKTVLVTGAAGFIGRHVLHALLDRDWEVKASIHQTPLPDCLRGNKRVKIFRMNGPNLGTLRKIAGKVQAICHLAAVIPSRQVDSRSKAQCRKINGLLTWQLGEMALKNPGTKFVYLSAGQIYRYQNKPVSEDAPIYPAPRAAQYLISKLVGELFLENLRYTRQLSLFTLRAGCCYGPGMSERMLIPQFLHRAAEGVPLRILEGGTPTCDYTYVTDVADLVAKALDRGQPGIYNVGSGHASSVLDVAHTVAQIFPRKKIRLEVTPSRGAQPTGFSALDIRKAEKMWNYKPLSLKEGLARYKRVLKKGGSCDCCGL